MRTFFAVIKHYMSGKGSIKRLILIWWLLLNIGSLIIGILIALSLAYYFDGYGFEENFNFSDYIMMAVGFINIFLALVVIFIYPFILLISLWKCGKKSKNKGFLVVFVFLAITPIQVGFTMLYLLGISMNMEYMPRHVTWPIEKFLYHDNLDDF